MPEILTVKELAALLKMTPAQVYELCRERVRASMKHPIPMLKINGNTRFNRDAVASWITELQREAR